MAQVYIIGRQRGGIKVGFSVNPANRRSSLQSGSTERLRLIWSAEFGGAAPSIEATTKDLLKPWRISGEWFDTNPLVAGLAIEAARDQNRTIDAFLDRLATCHKCQPDYALEMACEDEVERDFPELYARITPIERGTWTDYTGKTHNLPHKQFSRVIVTGLPETTYGCPPKPAHVAACEIAAKAIKLRLERRKSV